MNSIKIYFYSNEIIQYFLKIDFQVRDLRRQDFKMDGLFTLFCSFKQQGEYSSTRKDNTAVKFQPLLKYLSTNLRQELIQTSCTSIFRMLHTRIQPFYYVWSTANRISFFCKIKDIIYIYVAIYQSIMVM